MVGTLAYKKFKLEQWFPNISHRHTPACCIKKKKNMWWSSDQRYKQTAGKKQTMHPPDRYGFKIWKVNTLRWSKGHMWDNVTVFEEHTCGTPLYTPSSWYPPWKILVHPGVYNTPCWQALNQILLTMKFAMILWWKVSSAPIAFLLKEQGKPCARSPRVPESNWKVAYTIIG